MIISLYAQLLSTILNSPSGQNRQKKTVWRSSTIFPLGYLQRRFSIWI